jgi:hypothetical protein
MILFLAFAGGIEIPFFILLDHYRIYFTVELH